MMGTPAEPTRLAARLVRGGIAMIKHENGAILSSVRRGSGLALLWAGLAALVYVPTATAGVTTSAVAVLGFLSFRGWSLAVCKGSQAGESWLSCGPPPGINGYFHGGPRVQHPQQAT